MNAKHAGRMVQSTAIDDPDLKPRWNGMNGTPGN
jgi:hypothetical protein